MSTPDPWDPEAELRRAHAEIGWYRGLLERVAEGLERLAMELPMARGRLQLAAMWLRRTVWRGPPARASDTELGVGAGPKREDPEAPPGDGR